MIDLTGHIRDAARRLLQSDDVEVCLDAAVNLRALAEAQSTFTGVEPKQLILQAYDAIEREGSYASYQAGSAGEDQGQASRVQGHEDREAV